MLLKSGNTDSEVNGIGLCILNSLGKGLKSIEFYFNFVAQALCCSLENSDEVI